MSRWRILTIGKTDVYLQPALLAYGIYALVTGHGLFMGLAAVSILLHEAAHALVSSVFGQPPDSIELSPLGAAMRLDDDSRLGTSKRAGMLLAGPAVTLALCWLSFVLTKRSLIAPDSGRLLFMANLSTLLINLLPVLPLDGGRLLSLILGLFLQPRTVNRIMQCIGTLFGVLMITLNVWCSWKLGGWNFSLAFVGCCMLYSAATATMTHAMAELRSLMERRIRLERKGILTVVWIAALHMQTLRQLVRLLPNRRMICIHVYEVGSMRLLGTLHEPELISAYLNRPEMTCVELLTQIQTAESDVN